MPISSSGLFIRADASPQTGTGHVMRCLALAQAARERGIPVQIAGRTTVDWVRARLKTEGVNFTELDGLVPKRENPQALLAQIDAIKKPGWVILDGYHFGLDCQQAARAAGCKLLVIDDYAHLPEYSCDILLNQNIGAEELDYTGDIGQKLPGPKYALLRPEFLAARGQVKEQRLPGKARNILLTLGGGDFYEHLARIASYFAAPELTGCTLRVIAGAMQTEHIRTLFQDCPANVEILTRVDDMPALLLDTDLCVTAGGSTYWELCCLGVPFLTVEVAENQRNIIHKLQESGIAPGYAAGTFADLMGDGATRRKLVDAGLALVDGLGAGRVINAVW